MDKSINFEQNIKELEEVVRQLEGGDVSLDQLLALFEKGVGLAKIANYQLDNAEQKINMLIKNKTTGEMEEVPMDEIAAETTELPKGSHFVDVSDDVPPMPDAVDASCEQPQQSMLGFDDL